jgi:transcriptional regulator with XRE-family HTH domain
MMLCKVNTTDPVLPVVLRRLRTERGLSQEALAFASGVTVSTLSRIERGENSPTWATLMQIARALDVTPIELVIAVENARERPGASG